MPDPYSKLQGNIDESFGARFSGAAAAPKDMFESAGFTLPKADATTPATSSSAPKDMFESAGFSMPTPQGSAAPQPQGNFYIPWEGRTVATAQEYQKALDAHVNGPASAPETFQERAQREARDLGSKVSKKFSENLQAGGGQIAEGTSDITTNRPLGVGKIVMGALNAVPLNVLSTGFDVAKDTINNLTGGGASNTDVARTLTGSPSTPEQNASASFGERATMVLPGRAGATIAAKAVPEVNALSKVVEHIAEGGPQGIANAITTLRKNPTMTAMDVSPAVETTAIGIAKGGPSKGQTALFDAAGKRVEEAPANIMAAYDTGLGKTPNTVELLQAYKDNARKVGENQIQPALEATGPVNITSVVKHIDEQIGDQALRAIREGRSPPVPLSPIQERLLKLRQDLTYRGPNEILPKRTEYYTDATGAPNAAAVDAGAHTIQSELRKEADTLTRSGSGSDRLMGGVLGDVRSKLVDSIDRAGGGTATTPGPYKTALSSYRDEMQVQDAFEKGREVLSGARSGDAGLANRPEAFKQWMDKATDHEIAAARLGARTEIDNYIGTSRRNARAGMDLPAAPFTDAKIQMLFGEKEGKQLIETLQNERRKAEVNANLTKQSVTARALSAQKETAPREVGGVFDNARSIGNALALPIIADVAGGQGLATGLTAAAGILGKTYKAAGRAHDVAVNNQYARLASSTAPEDRNALIAALEAKQAEMTGRKPVNALAAAGGYIPRP